MYQINEIFYSIQGESSRAGLPCVFIRFAGCNLRCSFCDTEYAQAPESGKPMTTERILAAVGKFQCAEICLTGGEPLARDTGPLISKLLEKKYNVSVETNGSLDISALDARVHVVMDIKCPSSGQAGSNLYGNLSFLKPSDDLKFVLSGRKDYLWAKNILKKKNVRSFRGNIIFSPVHGKLSPETLAGWILKDGLRVRLQLQLHKLIGFK